MAREMADLLLTHECETSHPASPHWAHGKCSHCGLWVCFACFNRYEHWQGTCEPQKEAGEGE